MVLLFLLIFCNGVDRCFLWATSINEIGKILLFLKIKCMQANMHTFREQWLFIKVYRFACAHFRGGRVKFGKYPTL